jgi:hypothetical protein
VIKPGILFAESTDALDSVVDAARKPKTKQRRRGKDQAS